MAEASRLALVNRAVKRLTTATTSADIVARSLEECIDLIGADEVTLYLHAPEGVTWHMLDSSGTLLAIPREVAELRARYNVHPVEFPTQWAIPIGELGVLSLVVARGLHPEERDALDMLASVIELALQSANKVNAYRQQSDELYQFMRTLAHNLRNPLALMIGFAQLVKRNYAEVLDAEAMDYLDEIDQGGFRLSEMVEGVRTLAELQRSTIKQEAVPMLSVVQMAQRELIRMMRDKECTIEVDDMLPMVFGDGEWLTKAVMHLLRNAVQYGSGNVKIGADILPDERVRIWVQNNGKVIPLRQRSQLFVPFARVDEDDTGDTPRGGGLGLYIVRQIVERHHGEVAVQSDSDSTVFSFTVPLAPLSIQ
jgi:signal transduction histidine kinase